MVEHENHAPETRAVRCRTTSQRHRICAEEHNLRKCHCVDPPYRVEIPGSGHVSTAVKDLAGAAFHCLGYGFHGQINAQWLGYEQ